jgi:hypothetical protein
MGNADSQFFSTVYESWTNPEVVPKSTDKPKFDPNYGFKSERTERGMKLFIIFFQKIFLFFAKSTNKSEQI